MYLNCKCKIDSIVHFIHTLKVMDCNVMDKSARYEDFFEGKLILLRKINNLIPESQSYN